MNKKRIILTILIDTITLFFMVIFYRFLSRIINNNVSFLISMSLSLIINYLSYVKINNEGKNNLKKLLLFICIFILSIYFEMAIYRLLQKNIVCPNYVIKFIVLSTFLIMCTVVKIPLFYNGQNYFKNLKKHINNINNYWENFISKPKISFISNFFPKNVFVFIFMIFAAIFCYYTVISNKGVLIYSRQNYESNKGPLINKKINLYFDDIKYDDNSNDIVNNLCIPFGTYKRVNDSLLTFNLFDNKNNLVVRKTINTKVLKDGVGYCLVIPSITVSDLSEMRLEIITENASKSNSVTVFQSKKGEVAFSVYKTYSFYSLKYIVMLVFVIIYVIINFIINKYNEKIKNHHYLLLMLIYIFPILFIYPPLEVPDEPAHLKTSFTFAQQGMNGSRNSNVLVPKNIDCLNYSAIQRRDKVKDFNEVKRCIVQKENIKTERIFGSNARLNFSFMGYIASTIFLKTVDIFSNSPLLIFYFGRLGNLVLSLFIIYKALKIAPRHGNLLLLIATIPMFIQQMISYSYDSVLNSLSILLIAYFLAIMDDKIKFDFTIKIKLLVVLIFILSVKFIYLPLAILIVLIPKEKYGSIRKKILFIAEIIISLLLFKIVFDRILVGAEPIQLSEKNNLIYLMNNPLKVFEVVFNTIRFNTLFYVEGMFGYFSWFIFKINHFTIISYILIFYYAINCEKSILKKIKLDRLLIAFSVFIIVAAIFGSMYIAWSDYGLNYVDGVQGRYFIPLLGISFLALIPKNNKFKMDSSIIYSFINLVLLEYVIYLLAHFY